MYRRSHQHDMSSLRRAPDRNPSSSFRGFVDADDYPLDESLDSMTLVDDDNGGPTDYDSIGRLIERPRQRQRQSPSTCHHPSSNFRILPHGHTHRDDHNPNPSAGSRAAIVGGTESRDDPYSLRAQTARFRTATGRRNAVAVPSGVPELISRPSHRQGRQSQREETMIPLRSPSACREFSYIEEWDVPDQVFYYDELLNSPGR